MKVARSSRKFAYGGIRPEIRAFRLALGPTTPPLLYHRSPQMSIGNLHKKKRAFSALFHDAVNDIEDGKLFVTIEAGAEFLNVLPTSSTGVIDFVLFTSTIGTFDFHLTTNSFPNPQGCIRPCIPQKNCHPRSSYSRPHRPWYPS